MLGIAILCAISGLFLGLAVGFILGHKEGSKKTVEHFEKQLALQKHVQADIGDEMNHV